MILIHWFRCRSWYKYCDGLTELPSQLLTRLWKLLEGLTYFLTEKWSKWEAKREACKYPQYCKSMSEKILEKAANSMHGKSNPDIDIVICTTSVEKRKLVMSEKDLYIFRIELYK